MEKDIASYSFEELAGRNAGDWRKRISQSTDLFLDS